MQVNRIESFHKYIENCEENAHSCGISIFSLTILGTGAVVPYMPVYARQLGISTFVVGIIYSILPILGLISKPLFGALADRYVLYIFLCVSSTAFRWCNYNLINCWIDRTDAHQRTFRFFFYVLLDISDTNWCSFFSYCWHSPPFHPSNSFRRFRKTLSSNSIVTMPFPISNIVHHRWIIVPPTVC